jgi:hypothetical protein
MGDGEETWWRSSVVADRRGSRRGGRADQDRAPARAPCVHRSTAEWGDRGRVEWGGRALGWAEQSVRVTPPSARTSPCDDVAS